MSKPIDKRFLYLNKEIRHKIEELDNELQRGVIEPIAHAYWMDALRFVKARIEVAKLKENI